MTVNPCPARTSRSPCRSPTPPTGCHRSRGSRTSARAPRHGCRACRARTGRSASSGYPHCRRRLRGSARSHRRPSGHVDPAHDRSQRRSRSRKQLWTAQKPTTNDGCDNEERRYEAEEEHEESAMMLSATGGTLAAVHSRGADTRTPGPAEHATRRQLQRPLQPASAQAMPARIRPACEIPAPLPGSRCASSCGANRDGRERQGANHPRRLPRPRPDARTHARGQGILRRAQPAQGQRPARRYCATPPQQVLSTGELPWTDETKPRPCAERPRPRR